LDDKKKQSSFFRDTPGENLPYLQLIHSPSPDCSKSIPWKNAMRTRDILT
jgi:hypothetical protein